MTEYTTETGYYLIVDSDGRVMSKANVPIGRHPVDDRADALQSYDVASSEELKSVEIDPHYRE